MYGIAERSKMRHVRPETRRDEDDKLFIGSGSLGDAAPARLPRRRRREIKPSGPLRSDTDRRGAAAGRTGAARRALCAGQRGLQEGEEDGGGSVDDLEGTVHGC